MDRLNVTVSLPADLVKEARHLAVDKGLSLSAYLADLLEEQVRAGQEYRAAREAGLARLRKGYPLGTNGKITRTRDELHER